MRTVILRRRIDDIASIYQHFNLHGCDASIYLSADLAGLEPASYQTMSRVDAENLINWNLDRGYHVHFDSASHH